MDNIAVYKTQRPLQYTSVFSCYTHNIPSFTEALVAMHTSEIVVDVTYSDIVQFQETNNTMALNIKCK